MSSDETCNMKILSASAKSKRVNIRNDQFNLISFYKNVYFTVKLQYQNYLLYNIGFHYPLIEDTSFHHRTIVVSKRLLSQQS